MLVSEMLLAYHAKSIYTMLDSQWAKIAMLAHVSIFL